MTDGRCLRLLGCLASFMNSGIVASFEKKQGEKNGCELKAVYRGRINATFPFSDKTIVNTSMKQ